MKEISFFDEKLVGIGKYFPNENSLKSHLRNINFNLLFSHYPRFSEVENKFVFYISKDNGNKDRDRSRTDDKWLLGNKPIDKDKYSFFDKSKVVAAATQYYSAIADSGYELQEFFKEPDWRMIIGLGGESVYETGITLHHIYGFPYIPATAIKGIAHHYAREIGEQNMIDIFGSEDSDNPQRGKIIFFDAFPIDDIFLSPDIMNNHYPDYYDGGKKPPADWQSPRPIFFLTVKETSFKFVLGIKPKDQEKHPDLLVKAISILKDALTEKGIGAKTAVGYGYMKP